MSFKVINESFQCENCGQTVPKLDKSCRNHCPQCLYSKHVDQTSPGDRATNCHSLMEPIRCEQDKKREWMLVHQCLKCHKIIRNKIAPDDDFDKIIQLTIPKNE